MMQQSRFERRTDRRSQQERAGLDRRLPERACKFSIMNLTVQEEMRPFAYFKGNSAVFLYNDFSSILSVGQGERRIEMEKIRGVNLGNWLVLEKWMEPKVFAGEEAEDEVWLNRTMEKEALKTRMKWHRDTYVTEEDIKNIASHKFNMIRIPVPYFIFGDVEPFNGCIEYLDFAFDWAEKYGLRILIDLHTVPESQNGYDNGGITGVCKWCKNPKSVEFSLTVLERLAERYAKRKGLFGVEIVNEPISFLVWMTSPSRTQAVDKKEAKGSGYVPLRFLKPFYLTAYERLRRILPEEKAIVFHDGFRFGSWNRFFDHNKMKNVYLDTHIYILAMEAIIPIHSMWVYRLFIAWQKLQIRRVNKHVPVIVGEWCSCSLNASKFDRMEENQEKVKRLRREDFRAVTRMQLDAWKGGAGFFYWNYQMWKDIDTHMDKEYMENWDLRRCWKKGWMTEDLLD